MNVYKRYPLSYKGEILWPLIFLFLFPPVGILLLLFNVNVHLNNSTYYLHYKGSPFWLYFWTIIFFPIAIILAIINGFDIIELSA